MDEGAHCLKKCRSWQNVRQVNGKLKIKWRQTCKYLKVALHEMCTIHPLYTRSKNWNFHYTFRLILNFQLLIGVQFLTCEEYRVNYKQDLFIIGKL